MQLFQLFFVLSNNLKFNVVPNISYILHTLNKYLWTYTRDIKFIAYWIRLFTIILFSRKLVN